MFGFSKKKVTDSQKYIGIVVQKNEFYLSCISISENNTFRILQDHYECFADSNEFKQKLSSYILRNNLVNTKCNLVLNPTDYKLLVLDIPSIPEEEQMQALKWQILEKIDVEEKEVLIDIMQIPIKLSDDNSNKAYAVVVNKQQIIQTSSLIESARLELSIIDIAENALANLLGSTKLHDKNVAFIIKIFGNLTLLVCKDNRLLLTRKLSLAWLKKSIEEPTQESEKVDKKIESPIGLSIMDKHKNTPIKQLDTTKGKIKKLGEFESGDNVNKIHKKQSSHVIKLLVDEIQRSFEYCTNSLSLKEPEYIIYSNVPEIKKFEKEFTELVTQRVDEFKINDYLNQELIDKHKLNLVALGGALRYQNEKRSN